MTLYRTITITRPTADPYVMSYDVWTKQGAKPTCAGDGIYAGNVTVDADDTTATLYWTAPADVTDWQVIAIPIRNDLVGRPGGNSL